MTSPSEKSTEARSDRPIFDFFSVPPSVSTVPSLASSIQSLETCFFLLALDRYPHALTACVSAIESCIKASPSCQRENELWRLIKAAIKQSGRLSQFPEADLDDLRKTRNRIVHEGFIPKDDSHSVFLLLNVGFPFTLQCFSELHRLGLMRYMNSQYGKQINISNAVFRRVKRFQETNDLTEFEFTYCLRKLQSPRELGAP